MYKVMQNKFNKLTRTFSETCVFETENKTEASKFENEYRKSIDDRLTCDVYTKEVK